jgi:hypothetical protein
MRRLSPYPPPFDMLPAEAAALAMGLSGGAAPVLVAKRTASNVLTDAVGATPYAPASGDYYTQFELDSYVVETSSVGAPRLRDVAAGADSTVAAGVPAVLRLSGVSALSTSAYYANNTGTILAADPDEWTFGLLFNKPAYDANVECAADLNGLGAGNLPGIRVFVTPQSSFTRVRVRVNTSTPTTLLDVYTDASVWGVPLMAFIRVSRTSSNVSVRVYRTDTGALVDSTSTAVTLTSVPWTGGAVLGGQLSGGAAFDSATGIQWALWSSVLSDAACAALAPAPSTWGSGAAHWWQGATSGVYDSTVPTRLFRALTGGITAEY